MQDKTDEEEDRPLVRRRISPCPSSTDTEKELDCTTKSNPQQSTSNTSSQHNKNDSHSNEVLYYLFPSGQFCKKIHSIVTDVYMI